MRGALLVFKAEWGRLTAARTFHAVLLLVCLASVARAISDGITLEGHGIESGQGWHSLAVGWRTGLVLSTLILAFSAARGLAGDAQAWILRLALTRGTSRAGMITARLMLGLGQLALLVLCSGAGALLGGWFAGGYGPFVVDGAEFGDRSFFAPEFLRVGLGVLPALAATYAFALFVSAFCQNAVTAVAASIGLLLSFDLFKELLGEGSRWFFLAHTPTLLDSSGFTYLDNLCGLATSTALWEEGYWRAGMVSSLASVLIFTILAIVVLRRRAL